jgi:hypothetical protein
MAGFGSLAPDILPFGAGTPQEVGETPPNILDKILHHLISSTATLPQRAVSAAANSIPGLRREDYTDNPNAPQPSAPLYDAAGETALTMMGGSSAIPAEANSLRAGIRAYHGSPHDFDKFDLSKIGMGEGAQAYGHGLYFAENEGVARGYRDALSAPARKRIDPNSMDPQDIAVAFHRSLGKGGASHAERMAERYPAQADAYRRAAEIMRSGDPYAGVSLGKMYEVNINADPAHFLDWDKPLREQPRIAEAMQEVAPKPNWFQRQMEGMPVIRHEMATNPESTGATAYGALQRMTGEKSRATDMLREAGIPGIRYLDQGSRFAQPVMTTTPHGDVIASHYPPKTSNYVMFNDKLIDILRKYGIAGLPAAAGVAGGAAFGGPPKSEGM